MLNKAINMKTVTLQQLLLTLLGGILIPVTIFANDIKTYDGYVVLNNEERLTGKIEMLSPSLNEVKVKLINKNQERLFKAKEVKEYGFEVKKWNQKTKKHQMIYVTYVRQVVERSPVAFGPKLVLLEREVKGHISMYHHFIEQNTSIKNPYIHIIYLQKGNKQELVSISKENYKVILKGMVSDYSDLAAKVGTRGYTYSKLIDIITTYNNWAEGNQEEVVNS